MFNKQRLERAFRFQRETSGVEEAEEKKDREKLKTSNREVFHMMGSALLYFLPICLVVLLLVCLLGSLPFLLMH